VANEVGGRSLYAGSFLLDEVRGDDGETFPNASGASMSLDPDFLTPLDNDLGGLWCRPRPPGSLAETTAPPVR